jgi:carbonic anhydrase/acetyltransferase-like protein (isoleucine patch superfamily)
MNQLLAAITLLIFAAVWFCLPLFPTIWEIRRRREARPLTVDRENDGEVRHFARRFKAYLESNFTRPTLRECIDQGNRVEGRFSDGTPFQIVAKNNFGWLRAAQNSRSATGIIIFTGRVVLPYRLEFVHGIYSADDIDCGNETLIRSLYAEHSARLRQRSVVLRWLHVDDELLVEDGCVLYGRASAEKSIFIGKNVEFERIHSPKILFQNGTAALPPTPIKSEVAALTPFNLERTHVNRMSENCFSVDNDFYVPARTVVRGDFVVRGAVRIGQNARVEGSIKSHEDMRIEDGAVIEGSVISGRDLELGRACAVSGPAVASNRLTIHADCRIGTETHPTSAIAPFIFVDPGVSICGTVWARNYGKVSV